MPGGYRGKQGPKPKASTIAERQRDHLAILKKVEERAPGTKEKLAHWELMHTKLVIVP